MDQSTPLYNFYLQTTKEELKTKRGFSNESFTEFSLTEYDEIKQKLCRWVYFDNMLRDNRFSFWVVYSGKKYFSNVSEEEGNHMFTYKTFDIFGEESSLVFRMYIGMKKTQVYYPDPEGYITHGPNLISNSNFNYCNWPLLVLIKCLQLRNIHVFII